MKNLELLYTTFAEKGEQFPIVGREDYDKRLIKRTIFRFAQGYIRVNLKFPKILLEDIEDEIEPTLRRGVLINIIFTRPKEFGEDERKYFEKLKYYAFFYPDKFKIGISESSIHGRYKENFISIIGDERMYYIEPVSDGMSSIASFNDKVRCKQLIASFDDIFYNNSQILDEVRFTDEVFSPSDILLYRDQASKMSDKFNDVISSLIDRIYQLEQDQQELEKKVRTQSAHRELRIRRST